MNYLRGSHRSSILGGVVSQSLKTRTPTATNSEGALTSHAKGPRMVAPPSIPTPDPQNKAQRVKSLAEAML